MKKILILKLQKQNNMVTEYSKNKKVNCYSIESTVTDKPHIVVAEDIDTAISKFCDFWSANTGRYVYKKDITSVVVLENDIVY